MAQHRVTAVVNDTDFERIKYWADKKGISINDFVRDSVNLAIRYENRDYDIPTIEVVRLNQLIESMATLSYNVAGLERVVTTGFDALIEATRGENYLNKDVD